MRYFAVLSTIPQEDYPSGQVQAIFRWSGSHDDPQIPELYDLGFNIWVPKGALSRYLDGRDSSSQEISEEQAQGWIDKQIKASGKQIQKGERYYLKPGEQPPKGVPVHEGPQGGKWIFTRSRTAQELHAEQEGGGQSGKDQGSRQGKQDGTPGQDRGQGGPGQKDLRGPAGAERRPAAGQGQAGPGGQQQEQTGENIQYTPDPELIKRVEQKYNKRPAGQRGIETEVGSADELRTILTSTKFALISAGLNPQERRDYGESPDGEGVAKRRHQQLRVDLIDRGYVFTQVVGRYGELEDSYLVMCHDADKDDMYEMGQKYSQESVIFSDHGRHELIYTSNEFMPEEGQVPKTAGYVTQGHGFNAPGLQADNFYTEVFCEDTGRVERFSLNLFDETGKPYEPGMAKKLASQQPGSAMAKSEGDILIVRKAVKKKQPGEDPMERFQSDFRVVKRDGLDVPDDDEEVQDDKDLS